MIARRSLHSLWTFCAVLISTAAAAAGAWHWMLQHSLAEENLQAHRQLGLYAQALSQRLDRYRVLPDVLALDAELREALTTPQSPEQVQRLNHKLEQANGASLALVEETQGAHFVLQGRSDRCQIAEASAGLGGN